MPQQPHDQFDPLVHSAQPDHPDRLADARAAAARAVRDIGHALVGHEAKLSLVERVTVRSRPTVPPTADWSGLVPQEGQLMTSHDERPISGRASPWGLDLEVRREGDEAVARFTLRAAHEGAPGRSHGGIIAALFDDLYGFVLTLVRQPAFTGELNVRYRRATPIGVPLECRVRLDRQDGRKMFMSGDLLDPDGTVIVRSTALFIAIDREKFNQGA
jgi:acyl-coenzyme A thioesterase PaaI-like protein